MRFARVDGAIVVEYPLMFDDLKRGMPLRGWPGRPTAATLEGTSYVLVEDTPPPSVVFGETLSETTPVDDAGTWRQAWTVSRISLAQAKQQLAQRAIEIYWSKMLAIPMVAEMQAASGDFSSVIQNRAARFNPKLADVAQRIQAAATINAAYAIYLELEAAA